MAPALLADLSVLSDVPESRESDAAGFSIDRLFTLRGRSVIITGAGRGLGIDLARAVLEAGADVCCLDILPSPDEEEWRKVEKAADARRLHASYDRCDVTDEAAVEQMLTQKTEEARARGKPIRGLVNSAGIQQMEDALEYPMDGFRRIMEVNVAGSYIIAKQFARAMVAQKTPASVVLIASMSGSIANRASFTNTLGNSMSCVTLRTSSQADYPRRVSTVRRTTPAKARSTKCAVLWRTSGAHMAFG